MKLTLTRFETKENGTTGKLYVPAEKPFTLKTLELPFNDNMENISCINPGIYQCEELLHEKFGRCFHILNVEGRKGVLIHTGNFLDDTHGCILVGLYHYTRNGQDCVGESINAMNSLRYAIHCKTFELEIR